MRAAIYLRQSKDRDGNELAISRQRDDCLRLCKAKGWEPVDLTRYVDNDRSATNGKVRERYQLMLQDIKDDKVDAVVVWDLDRLHRVPIELEHFMKLADRKRLALATVSGDVDLGTDNGRLFARIKGAVGMAEVERKSARQKAAGKQRAHEGGQPWWPSRPFGYDADPDPITGKWWTARRNPTQYNEIRLHPTEAKLIKQAYAEVLRGGSLRGIAAEWNGTGATTPKGNSWSGSTVHQLLANPRNAGLRTYLSHTNNGARVQQDTELFPGSWPEIVSRDVWEGVCAILADPTRRSGASRARTHLLSGLAVCSECLHTMGSGVTSHAHTPIYRCNQQGCTKVSRDMAMVDAMVVEAVIWRMSLPDAIELTVDLSREDVDDLKAQAKALQAQVKAAEREYDDNVIDGNRLAARKARVAEKLVPITAALEDSNKAAIFDGIPLGTDGVDTAFDGVGLDRKRVVINSLVTVTVKPTSTRGRTFNREDVDVVFRQPVT